MNGGAVRIVLRKMKAMGNMQRLVNVARVHRGHGTIKNLVRGLALIAILLSMGYFATVGYAAGSTSLVVVRGGGAVVMDAPDGSALATLTGGTVATALGRDATGDWIRVETQTGVTGWTASTTLLMADAASLPEMTATVELSSATPLSTPLPTTPLPTPTEPAATVVASPAPSPVGIVGVGGAALLSAPDGATLAHLPPGAMLDVLVRSDDGDWLLVQRREDPTTQGWVATPQLLVADLALIPTPADASATPDILPTPDAAPAAASPQPVFVTVTAEGERLNIRRGPGTDYTVIAKALDGERYLALARDAAGTWLQIDAMTGYAAHYAVGNGWVAGAFVSVDGVIDDLPVVEVAPVDVPNVNAQPVAETYLVETAAASPARAATSVTGLTGTLVFQTGPGGTIYAYALESGTTWPVSRGFDPAISPDGQTVAFVRDGGENGIYLVDVDGSNERLIFSGRTRLSSPKWSPDGQWIVFTRSDEFTECYAMGRGCVNEIRMPPGMEIDPDAFALTRRYSYHLARVDVNGENYRDIASLESARAADWNEAGIVYQSDAGLQITADAPDAENRLVIFNYLKPTFDDPDWQPQGGRIVYMSKEGSHWELVAVNPDGSGQTVLTRPATTLAGEIPSNVAPAWSPDGAHIVFLSNRTERGAAGDWRIWVMDADGSNAAMLPVDVALDYTFGGEQAVSWGP